MQQNTGEIILYQTEDGIEKIELKASFGTVWLAQGEIAELFQRERSVITKHINNILLEQELSLERVCANFAHTAADGKTYDVQYYNLDMILAIGYRVKSARGIQFRKWATTTLKEYLVKGFAINDQKLKEGGLYFEELLERIRDIRSSEKVFYHKIRDIYKLSVDYDAKSEETLKFFKILQNKLHFSITGKCAAEIIATRADAQKPNMGLTNWAGGQSLRKSDVYVAKNYLNAQELSGLNRIVTMYLDYAEMQSKMRKVLYMKDWVAKLDAFLKFNEQEILHDAGKISMTVAKTLAASQYDIFHAHRMQQDVEEDVDFMAELVKIKVKS
jgi:hypothetical protein